MSIIVTGTGTGVGKTIACAVILARYARRLRLAYWKPIATGARDGRDAHFVRRAVGSTVEVLDETYLFDAPASPHLAARLQGAEVDPDRLQAALVEHAMADERRSLVIEGVGGVLVPLTARGYLFVDLALNLHLPCVVVAASGLGTINHTLLTLEAMRTRRLEVAGVILSGPRHRENRAAIERFGAVEVLAEIPPVRPLSRAGILRAARAFDRRGKLRRFLE